MEAFICSPVFPSRCYLAPRGTSTRVVTFRIYMCFGVTLILFCDARCQQGLCHGATAPSWTLRQEAVKAARNVDQSGLVLVCCGQTATPPLARRDPPSSSLDEINGMTSG